MRSSRTRQWVPPTSIGDMPAVHATRPATVVLVQTAIVAGGTSCAAVRRVCRRTRRSRQKRWLALRLGVQRVWLHWTTPRLVILTPETLEQATENLRIAATHISSFRISAPTNCVRRALSCPYMHRSCFEDELFDKIDRAAGRARTGVRPKTRKACDPTRTPVDRLAPRLTRCRFDRDGATILCRLGDTNRNKPHLDSNDTLQQHQICKRRAFRGGRCLPHS
jgi:hypothetical protein